MAYLDENGLEHFWGKIKDHVSSAIAPKANDADVLHKTGDETVQGVKTFQNTSAGRVAGETVTDLVIRNPEVDRGIPVEGGRSYTRVIFADAEGETEDSFSGRLGLLEVVSPKQSDINGESLRLSCYRYSDNPADAGTDAFLKIGYDANATPFAIAPATSDNRTDSTDIITRGYMEASEWNWQKTKKAGAVTFKPVPESDLEPVVDFMFTEMPPAEGEKGPENPSTITGVTQAKVTRCGKNLLPYPYQYGSQTINDVVFTVNSDGTVLANGTASANIIFRFNSYFKIKGGVPYCLSGCPTTTSSTYSINIDLRTEYSGGGYFRTVYNIGPGATFTVSNDCYCSIYMNIQSGISISNLVFKPQLEIGTTATSFEPYAGNNYTIQLGDTYYGGSLDVATGVMTVTWVSYIIDENTSYSSTIGITESIDTYGLAFYPDVQRTQDMSAAGNGIVCDRLPWPITSGEGLGVGSSSTNIRIYLSKTRLGLGDSASFSDVSDAFKNFFASNPARIVYTISSPYTVQLTPTQIRSLPALDKYEPRINTVYTDQEAVQVGYQRFANYVDLTTNQTIAGDKTFTDGVKIKALTVQRNTSSPAITVYPPVAINDGSHRDSYFEALTVRVADGISSNRLGSIRLYDINSNGNRSIGIYPFTISNAITTGLWVGILDVAGNSPVSYACAPSTPKYEPDGVTERTEGRDIVTRDWIPKDTRIVHTTGNENIDGVKTFIAEPHILKNGQSMLYFESVDAGYIATCGIGQSKALGFYHNTNGKWIFRWYPSNGSFEINAVTTGTAKALAGDVGGTLKWNGQTIQTTSDERLKTPLSEVPDAVLDAWEEVNWGQFQYLDAVASKGESARLHLGLIAQHVMSVFGKHGLDACAYGILCHEERPAVEEEETVVDAEAYVDEEGVEHSAVTHVETRHEDAVDLWMVRYAEAQAMEACCARRENARLKKRIAGLEERLAALELKIS